MKDQKPKNPIEIPEKPIAPDSSPKSPGYDVNDKNKRQPDPKNIDPRK